MKKKVYTSRGEKEADFFIGFFVMAGVIILLPALWNSITGSLTADALGIVVLVAASGFLLGAGVYRPWMALGGLGCLGTLLALGLLAAIFIAVVCSSGFR